MEQAASGIDSLLRIHIFYTAADVYLSTLHPINLLWWVEGWGILHPEAINPSNGSIQKLGRRTIATKKNYEVVATQRFWGNFHPDPWGFMIQFFGAYVSNGWDKNTTS